MNSDKYREIYGNYRQRMNALAVSFNSVLESEEIRLFFKQQMELRKKISGIFYKHFGEICCQCKGICCDGSIRLYKKDLLLFLSQNGLGLPESDWNFLNDKNCCVFLSGFGCILKEFRPWQCLKHICNEFSLDTKVLKNISLLTDEYELNVNRLACEIQKKWYLTID